MLITPNGIKIEGVNKITKQSQFDQYHLIYLKLQRLLVKEFQKTKNPEYQKMIKEVGKTYEYQKKLHEIPF